MTRRCSSGQVLAALVILGALALVTSAKPYADEDSWVEVLSPKYTAVPSKSSASFGIPSMFNQRAVPSEQSASNRKDSTISPVFNAQQEEWAELAQERRAAIGGPNALLPSSPSTQHLQTPQSAWLEHLVHKAPAAPRHTVPRPDGHGGVLPQPDTSTLLSVGAGCSGADGTAGGCTSTQRCDGWTWFWSGSCVDGTADNQDCKSEPSLQDRNCASGNCHGVHWVEASVGIGPSIPIIGSIIKVPVAGLGEAYCMPMENGVATGFADGTRCAYDSDCKTHSLCLGGGLLPTWVGVCTSCPVQCGDYGCHTCDNTNTSIQCNTAPVDFWGQTLGCVPAAAAEQLGQLEQCAATEFRAQAANYTNAAAVSASRERLKTCMLSAVAEGKECITNSTCNFQFDCLQFSDMVIASGQLATLVGPAAGRRMLQIDPVDKNLTRAWILRNYSKSIVLSNGTSTRDIGLGYSATESHTAVISFFGSAYFTAALHVGLNIGERVYELSFKDSGIQLDLTTTLELGLHAQTAITQPKDDTAYTSVQEFSLTDATGGVCADPGGSSCLPAQVYSQLYTLGPLPVLVQVSYQVKALVNFTAQLDAQFSAQLNYSQFFGFEELGVSINDGTVTWTVNAGSFVPDVTHKLEGDASGVVDFKSLVGVELTVMVNGVEAKALVGAWVKLGGSFSINALFEGNGLSVGGTTSEYCVSGELSAGVAPGLRVEAGVGLVDVLQSFQAQCSPSLSEMCDNPYGRVADCFANAVLRVDPCQAASDLCTTLGEEAQRLIDAPVSTGYFPLDSDTVGLSVQVSGQTGC